MTDPVALEPFGDAALRACLPSGTDARRLLAVLQAIAGVRDVVVTERHAMVTFDPRRPPEGVAEAIAGAKAMGETRAGPLVSIAVRYDGEDLASVAAAAGLTEAEVVARHAAAEYTVAAIGFMPGFAYLRGLDPSLVIARRATPRPRVPALAVAIAGPYSGVYPFASPGGWNLVGTAVGFVPFDPASGARVALGDRVRFVPVDGGAGGER